MIPKKNPRANLENKRVFFFLFGLSIALLMAITAFQYQSEVSTMLPPETSHTDVDDEVIPITIVKAEEPERTSKREKPKSEDPPIFVEDPDDIDLPTDFKNPFKSEEWNEEPVEIELPDEDPEPIPAGVFLENVARPAVCGDLRSSEEQMECLNRWIQAYISENTRYPEQARRLRLQDKVYVSFVVSREGDIEEVKVVRGAYEILNEEAERVVKSVPEFIPARQLGQPVRMSMTVPVSFKLSDY